MQNRREVLTTLAKATGAVVLLPKLIGCSKDGTIKPTMLPGEANAIPVAPPASWNPITFNKERGNQGAIPESYWPSINGAEGDTKHLGKHLPYQPTLESGMVPKGYVAIMWGDPQKGYARHPNAAKGPDNNHEGHWYNWIKIRKATAGDAEESQSTYSNWPLIESEDNGQYVAFGETEIESDGGRNTIYLAALPADVASGDTVRIWAHCLTHGEYVDFLTV